MTTTRTQLTSAVKTHLEQNQVSIPMHLYHDANNKICKKPRGKGWNLLNLETCEENFINMLGQKYQPVNGVGILTGERTNLTVVDYDSYKHDAAFDVDQFELLFEGSTYATNTINGGTQYYFQYEETLKQTQAKVIDIRNDGGVVTAPPTEFGGKRYSIRHEDEIKRISKEQLEFLKNYIHPTRIKVENFQAPKDFVDLCQKLLRCLNEEQRDGYTNWIKVVKALKAALPEADALALLMEWTRESPKFQDENWVEAQFHKAETFFRLNIEWLHKKARFNNPNVYYSLVNNSIFSNQRMTDIAEESIDPVKAAIRYFDQYHYKITDDAVSFAVVETDQVKIMTKRNLLDLYEHANVWYLDDKGGRKSANVVKEWLKWANMNKANGVTFYPNFRNPKLLVDDRKLNVFRGGLHKYDPTVVPDVSKFQPWLDHIHEVWCSGSDQLYDFTIGRLAMMIQKPAFRCPVNIVIRGEQGSGKSMIGDFIGTKVFGSKFYCYYSSMTSFLDNFNSEQEQALLIVLDEINSGGEAFKKSDALKSITSRTMKTINKKYGARYTVPDYSNMVFMTNNSSILRIEQGDRRYFMLNSSSDRLGDDEYFNQLAAADNLDAGYALFHFLMDYDLSSFNYGKIPTTEWKLDSMVSNIKPVTYCLLHYLWKLKESENPENASWFHGTPPPVLTADLLWETFSERYGAKLPMYTRRKFGCEVSAFLGIGTKVSNGKRLWEISPAVLTAKICRSMRVETLTPILDDFEDLSRRAGQNIINDGHL